MEETTQKRYRLSLADNNIYLTVEKGKDFPFPSKLERLMKELAKRKIMCQAEVLEKHFGKLPGASPNCNLPGRNECGPAFRYRSFA